MPTDYRPMSPKCRPSVFKAGLDRMYFALFGTLTKRLVWLGLGTALILALNVAAPVWITLLVMAARFSPLLLYAVADALSMLLHAVIADQMAVREGWRYFVGKVWDAAVDEGLLVLVVALLAAHVLS